MTVRIIEARSRDTEVWTPIAVGNATGAQGIRYIATLPRADAKKQTPELKTLGFNKDGGVSEADSYRQQLRIGGTSTQIQKMCKALDVDTTDYSWRHKQYDRKSLRLLSFSNHTQLNEYLLKHQVKPVVSGTEATVVAEMQIPEGERTVEELYQELGKIIATDPKVGKAKAVVAPQLNEFKLTDEQVLLLQRNIQATLIKNAGASIAAQLEVKANLAVVRLYETFGIKNPPVIKLTSEILPATKGKK